MDTNYIPHQILTAYQEPILSVEANIQENETNTGHGGALAWQEIFSFQNSD